MYRVTTFYRFIPIVDCERLRNIIYEACYAKGIKGTVILAQEGINSTIAGAADLVQEVLDLIMQEIGGKLFYQDFQYEQIPFARLKIKIKPEIVTLKQDDINPAEYTGEHVSPEEWNKLLQQENLVVIDVRNTYETDLGTFKNAIDPNTETFSDFPEYVKQLDCSQPIAMFCTGGVRCEKASAYMLKRGFKQVYQLYGGILNYIRHMKEANSLWQGKCFVFDERSYLL